MIFVRGMSGVMFKQLAYVVGFSLLCSLAAALTIVPMLANRLLRRPVGIAEGHESLWHRMMRLSADAFSRLESTYKGLLHRVTACLL